MLQANFYTIRRTYLRYLSNRPGGGIGRHKGFKIPRFLSVTVQVRLRAPIREKASRLREAFFLPKI